MRHINCLSNRSTPPNPLACGIPTLRRWVVRLALGLLLSLSAGVALPCPVEIETQKDLDDCAIADYQRADAALNAAWGLAKPAMDDLGGGGRTSGRSTQVDHLP